MKQLQRSSYLNKSVNKVYFKCNVSNFVQIYSLAVRTSVAVNFANLPLKECEFALKQKTPVGVVVQPKDDTSGFCLCYSRKKYRSKGLECERCRYWYHRKCGKLLKNNRDSLVL